MRDRVLRDQASDQSNGRIGKGHAEHATGDRQNHGLGEQLLRDAEAGGAEGEAGFQFLQTRRTAGKHQDGNVAAAIKGSATATKTNQGAFELAGSQSLRVSTLRRYPSFGNSDGSAWPTCCTKLVSSPAAASVENPAAGV